jgi:hypothetical protein
MSIDQLFQEAVALIGTGDVPALERLLFDHPELARQRLTAPGPWLRDKIGGALDGFFKGPYLLWFVAEDVPVVGRLPKNIAEVTRAILRSAQGAPGLKEQLDSALRLVCWSGVAERCGVQIELIDTLLDAGARPDGGPNNALVNGHIAAAEHLVERGAELTLASAVCLGRWDDARRLSATASASDCSRVSAILAYRFCALDHFHSRRARSPAACLAARALRSSSKISNTNSRRQICTISQITGSRPKSPRRPRAAAIRR